MDINIVVDEVGITLEDVVLPPQRVIQVTMEKAVYKNERALKAIYTAMDKYLEDNNLNNVGPIQKDDETLWREERIIIRLPVEEWFKHDD